MIKVRNVGGVLSGRTAVIICCIITFPAWSNIESATGLTVTISVPAVIPSNFNPRRIIKSPSAFESMFPKESAIYNASDPLPSVRTAVPRVILKLKSAVSRRSVP